VAVNSTKFYTPSVLGQLFRAAEPIGPEDGDRPAYVWDTSRGRSTK